jgi:Spy/CpxP family protein refolding chaperone
VMSISRRVGVGIVMLSLWWATASAQPHQGMRAMGPSRMMEDGPGMLLPLVLKGVDLTDAQEKRVQEIMAAHRARLRTLFGELQAAHRDLGDKLFAPGDVRFEDFTIQMQQIGELRERLMQEGLKVAIEVRGLLTPEQLARAAEIKDRMRTLRTEMQELFRDKH